MNPRTLRKIQVRQWRTVRVKSWLGTCASHELREDDLWFENLEISVTMSAAARELLKKQMIELTRDETSGFSVGLEDDSDWFRWRVVFEGPPDTIYYGGLFTAMLRFPDDFPNNPPEMKFETSMWHPNSKKHMSYFQIQSMLMAEYVFPYCILREQTGSMTRSGLRKGGDLSWEWSQSSSL